MKVTICGLPHTIVRCDENFESGSLGIIKYKKCEIRIATGLTPELEKNTITHEVIHGIFTHIGRNDLAGDETLVTSLATAINQTFDVRLEE